MLVSSSINEARASFIEDVKELGFEEVIKKYDLVHKEMKVSILRRIIRKIIIFLTNHLTQYLK